jgi:hypothetical protein
MLLGFGWVPIGPTADTLDLMATATGSCRQQFSEMMIGKPQILTQCVNCCHIKTFSSFGNFLIALKRASIVLLEQSSQIC